MAEQSIQKNKHPKQQCVGEDETDNYSHSPGYLYLVQKRDSTGHATVTGDGYYRTEVHPERRPQSKNEHNLPLCETHVTNMNEAERKLRETFAYAYHKSTQEGWFQYDKKEETISKFEEVIKPWTVSKNSLPSQVQDDTTKQ